MWKSPLGGLPIRLYGDGEISKIVKRHKGASRRKIKHAMAITELDRTFKTNETLEYLFNDVLYKYKGSLKEAYDAPSQWRDLLEDIKNEYQTLSKKGITHSGRERTIEPLFKYLFYKCLSRNPECMRIVNPTYGEVKASESAVFLLFNPEILQSYKSSKRRKKKFLEAPRVRRALINFVAGSPLKWYKSFINPHADKNTFSFFQETFPEQYKKISKVKDGEKILEGLVLMTRVQGIIRGRDPYQTIKDRDILAKRGFFTFWMFYSIKKYERLNRVKILVPNKQLSQIWGIPLSTFERRLNEIYINSEG